MRCSKLRMGTSPQRRGCSSKNLAQSTQMEGGSFSRWVSRFECFNVFEFSIFYSHKAHFAQQSHGWRVVPFQNGVLDGALARDFIRRSTRISSVCNSHADGGRLDFQNGVFVSCVFICNYPACKGPPLFKTAPCGFLICYYPFSELRCRRADGRQFLFQNAFRFPLRT